MAERFENLDNILQEAGRGKNISFLENDKKYLSSLSQQSSETKTNIKLVSKLT